ncbi:NUDIX hydrolase, partial [Rhizobiaceae sp. 2RAB30]
MMLAKRGKLLSQVGVLPYRPTSNGVIEVLLITSRRKKRFILPKGWKMKGKTKVEAAAQEAREEAGVVGPALRTPVGVYRYKKRLGAVKAPVSVTMFPMQVRHELSKWSEQRERKRAWV